MNVTRLMSNRYVTNNACWLSAVSNMFKLADWQNMTDRSGIVRY